MIPPESHRTSGKVRFADFVLDLGAGEIHRGRHKVVLQDKPFQLLKALAARPGKTVTREELRRELWDENTFVDFDNNLNAAVKKLRDALGDSADRPRFVETVPRKGYRFIAETTVERAAAPRPAGRSRRAALAAAAGVLAGLALLVLWAGARRTGPPSGRAMLLVLPFENLTGDPAEDYLSDGLTEDTITHLARLDPGRLGVIARLSAMTYKATAKSPGEIADELGVGYVLHGGVQRVGDRLRVTAQLVETGGESLIWAEIYDLGPDELAEGRDRVVARVAGSLAVELLPRDRLAGARAGTLRAEAYRHYLRGRHRWHEFDADGYLAAVEHFRRALAEDPGYAAAHAALADAYNLLAFAGELGHADAFARARAAAEAALAIDERLAEAHNALAFAELYGEWDLAGARAGFERAIELAPGYAMAYHWYAGALAAAGDHDAAIAAMERSLELDPVSLSVLSDLAWYYIYADLYEEAVEICRRTLERSPGYGWAKSGLIQALRELGRTEEARTLALEVFAGRDERVVAALGLADPAAALESATRAALELRLAGSPDPAEALDVARQYATLGEPDAAFGWLERAFEFRDPWLVFLEVDPQLDPLHGDPRFTDLSRRIGLRAE